MENSESSEIYHHEFFILSRKKLYDDHELNFTIPLSDPLPSQIYVRVLSDRWLGAETVHPVSFQHLIRPDTESVFTDLLNLQPLPVTALKNPLLEEISLHDFRLPYIDHLKSMSDIHGQYARLPHLKRLSVVGCSSVASLLTFMELPRDVTYICDLEDRYPASGDICPPDISRLANMRDITRIKLHFLFAKLRYIIYAVGESSAFRGGSYPINWTHQLDSVVKECATFVHEVKELWIDGQDTHAMKSPQIRALVSAMHALERCYVFVTSDEDCQMCLEGLLFDQNEIPCPNLAELHITVSPGSQSLFKTLFRVFTSLRTRNYVLPRLKLYLRGGIAILDSVVAKLSGMVGILEIVGARDLPTMKLNAACTQHTSAPWYSPSWTYVPKTRPPNQAHSRRSVPTYFGDDDDSDESISEVDSLDLYRAQLGRN